MSAIRSRVHRSGWHSGREENVLVDMTSGGAGPASRLRAAYAPATRTTPASTPWGRLLAEVRKPLNEFLKPFRREPNPQTVEIRRVQPLDQLGLYGGLQHCVTLNGGDALSGLPVDEMR